MSGPRLLYPGLSDHSQAQSTSKSDSHGLGLRHILVQELLYARTAEQRQGREAVYDLQSGDGFRLTDAAQVDRPVPGQEQADVVGNALELRLRDPWIVARASRAIGPAGDRREAGADVFPVGLRQRIQVVNERRERFAILR